MLHLVRAGHLNEAQQITTIMLINKLAPALKMPVLNQSYLQCVLLGESTPSRPLITS